MMTLVFHAVDDRCACSSDECPADCNELISCPTSSGAVCDTCTNSFGSPIINL
eukprot:m.190832 g.190832  ORF g.190832 m.190832 type:complete len:53 (-) comp32415_c1_seq1:813-971(-)